MTTDLAVKNTYASQRSIYDKRYEVGRYDHRSAVRVLTAEWNALNGAVERALTSNPAAQTISLFDFGYGTGRVTNEFIESYVRDSAKWGRNLLVVAYDVSSVGLMKAKEALCSKGFVAAGSIDWKPDDNEGYIAGRIFKEVADLTATVVFVHGNEAKHPEVMRQLALRVSRGQQFLVTTSWYSGLGHIPSQFRRREYFRQLSILTSWRGEMVFSVSSTGDLSELQPEWSKRAANGDREGFPVEALGDLVYETELGQSNFYHVFGDELNDHMKAITTGGQHWWVEGIRYPEEEFATRAAEQDNYRRVCDANKGKRGRIWTPADYEEFHTVAAFRSPLNPGGR
jgi:hypothetical protein